MEKGNLPQDWKWVKLGDVADYLNGRAFKPTEWKDSGKPIIRIQNLNKADAKYNYTKDRFEDKYKVKKGDLLFAWSASLGAYIWKGEDAWLNQHIFKVVPKESTDKFYLFYLLEKIVQELYAKAHGSGMVHVTKSKFESTEIPLPPLGIQKAIVSKIEELFSELDKGIENLCVAQQQLKTYRQAVLKWAFEGRLTNENVKEGELPEGWTVTTLGDHITNINSGKSYRCDERTPKKGEVGIIKVSSVTWGFFDETESKTCFSKELLFQKYLIKRGDFLFSRANTIDLIGSCVIVSSIEKTLMLSDKILRFVFCDNILPEYVLYYLRSRNGRRQIEALSTGNQASMRNIGQEKIRGIQIFYCNKSEQKRIVQEIEKRMSKIERLENIISHSLEKIELTKNAILKKAFKGELI